jgi:hypothetical protein
MDPKLDIFVATDAAEVIDELILACPEYRFKSLTESDASGYVHASFKTQPPEERRRQTVRFFAQLEYLRDSTTFIGSKTTNVSWITNAFRGGRQVIWVD